MRAVGGGVGVYECECVRAYALQTAAAVKRSVLVASTSYVTVINENTGTF